MKSHFALLILVVSSCGGGISNYSEEISGNYIFSNQGEGANAIYGNSQRAKYIDWVKKYYDNGKYICVWQADSALITDPKPKEHFKRNTYYPSDRFYIIDIKKDTLLGPYKKDEFFRNAKNLNIEVSWQPVVTSD